MEDINLATVPTSQLVQELRKRFDETEAARKELGFGPTIVTNRSRKPVTKAKGPKDAQTAGGAVIAASQRLRHAKKRHAPKADIAQLQRALEQAQATLAAEKQG